MRYVALVVLMAAACRADDSCPFLNAATADGVLGGEVTSHVTGNLCVFAHASSQLRIEVQTVSLPHKSKCEPNPTSLKAIGNEAFACSIDGKNGTISEQITGRVRDRAFFILLTSNNIVRAALREKARSVAEQVAGILF
jgi:hypothetical protein